MESVEAKKDEKYDNLSSDDILLRHWDEKDIKNLNNNEDLKQLKELIDFLLQFKSDPIGFIRNIKDIMSKTHTYHMNLIEKYKDDEEMVRALNKNLKKILISLIDYCIKIVSNDIKRSKENNH